VSVHRELRLGTRGSPLARWQANAVAARIAAAGGPPCRIIAIRTSGDRLQEAPLSEVGGKRLFVKEIEDALLSRDVDVAVHSSKDLPTLLPDGLTIAGVLPREDPRDAVVLPVSARGSRHGAREAGETAVPLEPSTFTSVSGLIEALGPTPSIGTGSVRRIAQLTRLMTGAHFMPIRGNLDTRLRKLDSGERDALVLAAAGLRRLGLAARVSLTLPTGVCVPAPGQGIVAIETRADDDVRRIIETVDDEEARIALAAERAVVGALGGGCQIPIGALASAADDGYIELVAVVIALDGSRIARARARGPKSAAAALGADVGARLIADGADEILADVRRQRPPGSSDQTG
jgi:hydroxymethylbilane synthase